MSLKDIDDINNFKPTCPVIFFQKKSQETGTTIFTIHCQKLAVNIECYVSTAIIKMEGEWVNKTNEILDCVFALPTPGTVMNVTLQIGGNRVLTTAIIPNEDAQQLLLEHKDDNYNAGKMDTNTDNTELVPEEQNPYEQYIPELFRLPFGNVSPGDIIRLKCEYLEPLQYHKRGYIVKVPLYFPRGTIVESLSYSKVVTIKCKINALSPSTQVDCASHQINAEVADDDNNNSGSNNSSGNGAGTILIDVLKCKPMSEAKINALTKYERQHMMYDTPDMFDKNNPFYKTGRDFYLRYSVRDTEILSHCIHQQDIDDRNCGSLCLMITPPTTISTTFGRAFFFLLDRSGSMIGEPYAEAIRALHRTLDRLRPSDVFNVCAFDHRQIYFNEAQEFALVEANNLNKQHCKQWLQSYQPERGGTVMHTPIETALQVLEHSELLPFLMLITDGAVANEREICTKLQAIQQSDTHLRSRFLTLGIGSFCNWFFLKMLSKIGRGFSEVVVYSEKIYHTIDHLMGIANTPVLTDIEIGLASKDIEVYPFPIPDLFLGQPVVVAAKYYQSNQCPKKIAIRGFDPHGNELVIEAHVETRDDLPVEKIFVKQQIDLMTADAWLNHSDKLEKRIVDISCANNMPSMYTSTVMFETTLDAITEEERKWDDEHGDDNHNNGSGGSGDDEDDENDRGQNVKKQRRDRVLAKMKNNKKTVAAMAVGGTLAIVAVGIMSFGDVGQTMANVPVLGADGLGGALEGCCDDCGGGCDDCDCDDCDCDDCDLDCGDCVVM